MELPPQLAKVAADTRASVRAAVDQSQPFGRLVLVHCLQAVSSSLVAISLAGSLFFSISPHAAKGRVLLYLLLTIAPFALVGPALSPLLDRGRQARRTSVAVAGIGSALACLGMARSLHDLWLFPQAFAILVLAKLYGVARAAIVPELAGAGDDLAVLNARLAVAATIAGLLAVPFGIGLLKIGAPWVLRLAAVSFVAGGVAAVRLPNPERSNVRMGRAMSEPPSPASPAGGHGGRGAHSGSPRPARVSEVAEARRVLGLPLYPPEVIAAVRAMSVARATVGFVEFFLAFELRRERAATWWFGLLLIGSAIGSLLGSMIVPRLRSHLSEREIIAAALVALVAGGLISGLVADRWSQVLLTFVVGIAPMSAKPALDSQVQRSVPPALLGRSFGRIETRLQLFWVAASLIGVLVPFPLRLGDGAVAAASLVAVLSYLSGGLGRTDSRIRLFRPYERPTRGAEPA